LRFGECRLIAVFAQQRQLLLGSGSQLFQFSTLGFRGSNTFLLLADDVFLCRTFGSEARQFTLADGATFADTRHLVVELAECMAGGHYLLLSFALVSLEPFEQGSE